LTQNADCFTGVDRLLRYDITEAIPESYAASRLCRASGKTGERSNFGGERFNFEGERSNFEGDRSNCGCDRGKSWSSAGRKAVSPAKS